MNKIHQNEFKRLKKIEEDTESPELANRVIGCILLLTPTPTVNKFKNEKKANLIQKEINQLAKQIDNLSPETIHHLTLNGFDLISTAKALNVPYIRSRKDEQREFVKTQMILLNKDYDDNFVQDDLKEICFIILKSINYDATNLNTVAYNIVKDIMPAHPDN